MLRGAKAAASRSQSAARSSDVTARKVRPLGAGCGRSRRGDALTLFDAANLLETALSIELEPGLRRDQPQRARSRIFDDHIHQAPADALALLTAIDHHEAHGAEALAVLPPQRRSGQRALLIAYSPTTAQLMMKLPVLDAMRPVLRLRELQRFGEIRGQQSPDHQKYRTQA